jgi:hypothetical protein
MKNLFLPIYEFFESELKVADEKYSVGTVDSGDSLH